MHHYIRLKPCPLLWFVKFSTFRSVYKKWNIFWLNNYFDLNFFLLYHKYVCQSFDTENNDTRHRTRHSVLRRSKKIVCFVWHISDHVTWTKKISIFFLSFERQFYNKKQALTFAILTRRSWVWAFYVCIGKNRYFELRHVGDIYFFWKGLNMSPWPFY